MVNMVDLTRRIRDKVELTKEEDEFMTNAFTLFAVTMANKPT